MLHQDVGPLNPGGIRESCCHALMSPGTLFLLNLAWFPDNLTCDPACVFLSCAVEVLLLGHWARSG